MTMVSRQLTILSAALIPALCQEQPATPLANVSVLPIDDVGRVLRNVRVVSLRSTSGIDYAKRFNGLSADGVPRGAYTLRLGYTDGPPNVNFDWDTPCVIESSRTVVVALKAPNVWVGGGGASVGDSVDMPPQPLLGQISSIEGDTRPLWVRIDALFGPSSSDNVGVAENGQFSFARPTIGRTKITVFREGLPIAQRIVDVGGRLLNSGVAVDLRTHAIPPPQ
jgi:hypothetical protein